jgi:hypothetical protein
LELESVEDLQHVANTIYDYPWDDPDRVQGDNRYEMQLSFAQIV